MEKTNIRNVTSNRSVLDISSKEITIPLAEYADLIAKETVLGQIRYVVSREACDYGTVGTLTAILQIDIPEKRAKSVKREEVKH